MQISNNHDYENISFNDQYKEKHDYFEKNI